MACKPYIVIFIVGFRLLAFICIGWIWVCFSHLLKDTNLKAEWRIT